MSVINNLIIAIKMYKLKQEEKLNLVRFPYPKEDIPTYGVGHSYVYVQTRRKGVKIL